MTDYMGRYDAYTVASLRNRTAFYLGEMKDVYSDSHREAMERLISSADANISAIREQQGRTNAD